MSGILDTQVKSGQASLETDYNAVLEQRRMRFYSNLSFLAPNSFQQGNEKRNYSVYSIRQNHYYLMESSQECFQLNQPPTEVENIQQMISDLFTTSFNGIDGTLGALLGEEDINGVRTKHYLLLDSTLP
jgi:hypothetical protein